MITAALLGLSLALPPLMPVDDIAPGQTGECLTVFKGETIEPFPFVVRDVMPNFLGPGQDLVLIRLQGEKAEFTGVVAGMSGSPCSIDGRLVGALSYSFAAFAKEPIAGVTPMKAMLEIMKLPEEKIPWRLPGKAGKSPKADAADWDAMRDGTAVARAQPSPTEMVPIATPLTMGGVLRDVREHFSPWLRSKGFEPVAGGSGARVWAKAPKSIEPGSAVAALLIRGDVDIAATGTVTSVEGKEVLAFGHPFLGVGALSVPMATARIHNTMASAMRSFKMSGTGITIGEFTQDRLTAIGGYLGREAAMIPVKGTIKAPQAPSEFELLLARDSGLSPRLLAIGLANSLSGRADIGARGTVRIAGTVKAKGLRPVEVRNVYSAQTDPNIMVYGAVDMARTFATLWDTPFGPPKDMEVSLTAEVEPESHEEYIESVHLGRASVRPGELLEVAVRLRENDGPLSTERFTLTIPHSWAGRTVDIIATGVQGAEQVAGIIEGSPRPKNLEQVARWLRERRGDGYLYLMAVRGGSGMRANVQSMPFLPGTAIATLSGTRETQSRDRGVAWEERRTRPGVVMGGTMTPIKVMSY